MQGVIAYLCGIALPFPGFIGTLGPHVSVPAQELGHLGWMLSFAVSFVVYYLLCKVWPTRNQKIIKEMGLRWEEMGNREIIAADGTAISAEWEGYPDRSIETGDEKWGESHVVGVSPSKTS